MPRRLLQYRSQDLAVRPGLIVAGAGYARMNIVQLEMETFGFVEHASIVQANQSLLKTKEDATPQEITTTDMAYEHTMEERDASVVQILV